MDDVDRLLAEMALWLGQQRVDEAARSRARERWLRQQKIEDAHFAGVALDFAERGDDVTIRTSDARSHHGRIAAVGRDFLVLRSHGGRVTLLALAAVVSLRAGPVGSGAGAGAAAGAGVGPAVGAGSDDAMSDRREAVAVSLAAVLAGLSAERPQVQLVTSGAELLVGELRAVGDDVVTLRLLGEPRSTIYVRLASVTECSFGSG